MKLDRADLEILRLLQEDGKTALAKLGEAVDLSAPSVLERVRKMETAGVIRGYTALVDGRQVGLDVTAFIGVGLRYPRGIDAFEELMAGLAHILECHHITGSHTMMLKVKVENTTALEKLISQLRATPGVDRTETMVVLSTLFERTAVPVGEPSELPPARSKRVQA